MKQGAIILCVLWLAGCASPPTTTPNSAPLELGMNLEAASVALGVPLLPVEGGVTRSAAALAISLVEVRYTRRRSGETSVFQFI